MNKKISVNVITFLAIPLGIFCGFINVPLLLNFANSITELFLKAFKLIGAPIVFFSLSSCITGMKGFDEIKHIGKKIITYTFSTTLIASFVALILFLLIRPISPIHSNIVEVEPTQHLSTYLSFLFQIIPDNLLSPFINNNIISVAFLGAIIGLATLHLPEKNKKSLHLLFSSIFSLILKITEYLIYLMPLAIWAFSMTFSTEILSGKAEITHLALYAICVLGSNLLQGFLILPLFLKWKKLSPLKIAKGMYPALLTAFFSKSSNTALPIAIKCAEKNLKITPKVAKVTFPMCSVINMNGCASFMLTTVLFVSTSNGISFSPLDLVIWVFLATFAAIGNAGVPMGCYFLSSAFLVGMGVPLHILGLILPLYAIFDMVETALNVWSDSTIAAAVEQDLLQEQAKVVCAEDKKDEQMNPVESCS